MAPNCRASIPGLKAGPPLHGANLIPDDALLPDLRRTVLEYIDQVTRLGHRVLEAIAVSLGLASDYFSLRYAGYTVDPLILFRIFLYASRPVPADVGAFKLRLNKRLPRGASTVR